MQNILVTGANRGLGFGLIHNLAKSGNKSTLFMGCRNLDKANEALKKIKDETNSKHEIKIVPVDLNDQKSFENIKKSLLDKDQRLSVLVNNAGVKYGGHEITLDQATHMMNVNYYNQKALVDYLLDNDLFEDNSKILNMSSTLANSAMLADEMAKERALNLQSYEDIDELIKDLLDAISKGEYWFSKKVYHPTYMFTKYIFGKYSHLLSQDAAIVDKNMQVYALCPGWVRTDMGGPSALLSIEQGVTTQRFLIDKEHTIDPKMQGKLIYNKKPVTIK